MDEFACWVSWWIFHIVFPLNVLVVAGIITVFRNFAMPIFVSKCTPVVIAVSLFSILVFDTVTWLTITISRSIGLPVRIWNLGMPLLNLAKGVIWGIISSWLLLQITLPLSHTVTRRKQIFGPRHQTGTNLITCHCMAGLLEQKSQLHEMSCHESEGHVFESQSSQYWGGQYFFPSRT